MRWELKPREPIAAAEGPDFSIQGFGADALGGEGQSTVHVTNLNDAGAGSLRAAIEGTASNRIVVFDLGGTIALDSRIEVNGHHITIDGTSAPSPGITLTGESLVFGAGGVGDEPHHIIVKSIRHRGLTVGGDDIRVFTGHDIAFDHCSVSLGEDGGLDITESSYNVTLQWCILKELGTGNGATLIKYNTYGVTIHHCIYNSWARGPLISVDETSTGSSQTMLDFVNNIEWRWGASDGAGYGYGVGVDHGGHANVVNSFFQANGSYTEFAIELNHNGSGGLCYASGNYSGNGEDVDGMPLRDGGNSATPFTAPSVTTEAVADAVVTVLANAGCRGDSFGLDATDQAIVDDITNNGNLP